MKSTEPDKAIKFSIVIPCYNEESTLRKCVDRVLQIADDSLSVEIIIVDDCSTDGSMAIAKELEDKYSEITVNCERLHLIKE